MSVIDEVLKASEQYTKEFTLGHLSLPPARQLAVLACMDARLMVGKILGLKATPTSSGTPGGSSRKTSCDP
jgi:carbonic anhydrase